MDEDLPSPHPPNGSDSEVIHGWTVEINGDRKICDEWIDKSMACGSQSGLVCRLGDTSTTGFIVHGFMMNINTHTDTGLIFIVTVNFYLAAVMQPTAHHEPPTPLSHLKWGKTVFRLFKWMEEESVIDWSSADIHSQKKNSGIFFKWTEPALWVFQLLFYLHFPTFLRLRALFASLDAFNNHICRFILLHWRSIQFCKIVIR